MAATVRLLEEEEEEVAVVVVVTVITPVEMSVVLVVYQGPVGIQMVVVGLEVLEVVEVEVVAVLAAAVVLVHQPVTLLYQYQVVVYDTSILIHKLHRRCPLAR